MSELHYWNITFKISDAKVLYETLNDMQPGIHCAYRPEQWSYIIGSDERTTMVEFSEEDAFLLGLRANVRIERIDK